MTNILEAYYKGISRQLQSEVDFINSLFKHNGVKGEGNENILRDLIKKFIPKKYGVGTGIIIDKHGNQSKQVDIIIYDQMNYPAILSLASVHMFPVDIVYAVIEVKTTLNSTEAKKAIANIASVKALDLIKENFIVQESFSGKIQFNTYEPSHPRGVVFSYDSDVENFQCFKQWFTPEDNINARSYPTLIGCMDQGIVKFKNAEIFEDKIRDKFILDGFAIPLNDGKNKPVSFNDKKDSHINDIYYPIKKVGEYYVPIDQSRVLLYFLLALTELIKKTLNPNIQFSEHYLNEAMRLHIKV